MNVLGGNIRSIVHFPNLYHLRMREFQRFCRCGSKTGSSGSRTDSDFFMVPGFDPSAFCSWFHFLFLVLVWVLSPGVGSIFFYFLTVLPGLYLCQFLFQF